MMVSEQERRAFEMHYEVIDALKEWPKLPSPFVLKLLGEASNHTTDSAKGKEMQRDLGLSVIPPKAECEWGAGLWDRITQGAWRDHFETSIDK